MENLTINLQNLKEFENDFLKIVKYAKEDIEDCNKEMKKEFPSDEKIGEIYYCLLNRKNEIKEYKNSIGTLDKVINFKHPEYEGHHSLIYDFREIEADVNYILIEIENYIEKYSVKGINENDIPINEIIKMYVDGIGKEQEPLHFDIENIIKNYLLEKTNNSIMQKYIREWNMEDVINIIVDYRNETTKNNPRLKQITREDTLKITGFLGNIPESKLIKILK